MDLSFYTFPYHTRGMQDEEQRIINYLLQRYPKPVKTMELLHLFTQNNHERQTNRKFRVNENKIYLMLITRLLREKKLRRHQPVLNPTHRVRKKNPKNGHFLKLPPRPKKIQANLIRLQEAYAQAIFRQKENDSG